MHGVPVFKVGRHRPAFYIRVTYAPAAVDKIQPVVEQKQRFRFTVGNEYAYLLGLLIKTQDASEGILAEEDILRILVNGPVGVQIIEPVPISSLFTAEGDGKDSNN